MNTTTDTPQTLTPYKFFLNTIQQARISAGAMCAEARKENIAGALVWAERARKFWIAAEDLSSEIQTTEGKKKAEWLLRDTRAQYYQAEEEIKREIHFAKCRAERAKTQPPARVTIEHQDGDSYVVTGTNRDGKRFKAIHTGNLAYATQINLYNGAVWRIRDGKRTLLYRVNN